MIDLPPIGADGSIWVFGYGSLMWNPGFEAAEVARARLFGFQRRFCIYSVHHRGSPDRPGLVLGLDAGGTCEGLAFRIASQRRRETLAYLRAREQINGVYRERAVKVQMAGSNETTAAVAFTAERRHPSYAGRLPLDRQAKLIRAASGKSGANLDYLFATLQQLERLSITDAELRRLLVLVGPHFSRLSASPGTNGMSVVKNKTCGLRLACQRFPVQAPLMRPDQRRRFTHRTQIAVWRSQQETGRGGDQQRE
ncbi:MAG: hypothetical protein RLZ98_1177 [Pseudomonadota bacterium]|jgi:cation transport protein ChaC